MTDFLITPSGDLVFSEANNDEKRLTIKFYKSNTKVLKIGFDTEEYATLKANENALTIKFDILEVKNNKRANLIQDEAYIMQQILIRLRTSLGELPLRQEIGSMLETVMHKDLDDKSVHNKIKNIISDSISDLLYDYSIEIVSEVEKSDRYHQRIKAYIYKEDSLFMSYGLEG